MTFFDFGCTSRSTFFFVDLSIMFVLSSIDAEEDTSLKKLVILMV